MGDENLIRTLRDYSKPSHEGYRNTIELIIGSNMVPLRSDTIRLVQNGCSFHGLRSENPNQHLKDFLKLVDSLDLDSENRERMRLQDLALYDNESWNDPRDSAKPVKAVALPQDVPSTSDCRLIELKNQVQRLMEARLAPTQPAQVNKITTSCEICSVPHDTQYCMEDPEQAFVEYASLRTNEAGGKWYTFKTEQNNLGDTYNPSWRSHPNLSQSNLKGLVSNFMASQDAILSKFEADFKQQQSEMTNKINTVLKAITDRIAGTLPSNTVKNPKLSTTSVLSARDDGEVMFIEIIRDDDEPQNEGPNEGEGATTGEPVVEYFDTFPTRDELTYHRYLMSGPIPLIFLRNPILMEGCPSNLKIPCNIGHVHIEKAYIDLNSPLNIMTRMMYNWIIRRKLNPRENANGGISNFIGRIKGMHVFVGNFTYVVDFMIVKDISSIIDPRLSQVVLGRPFVEISNMTHDPPEGVHTKLVYLRNDEDKGRGVEYVMSKILGFYKECLELGLEYLTGMDDDGEVTLYLMRRSLEVLRKFHWIILGGQFNQLSHVSSPLLSKP
ncbi:hypothetical protein Tco_0033680 [Tanacetum coccineum]